MLKYLIVILWISASFFASLFGLTLNPTTTALEAFARVISVSVITPILAKIIFGLTSSCLIFSIALFSASLEPWTSDLIIIGSSLTVGPSSKADSFLVEIKGSCLDS